MLKHGETIGNKSAEYRCWESMNGRCYTPTATGYAYYGGRGITVCERWRLSFSAFLADVGRRPSADHSIDRYPDTHGNYEPSNVRWATRWEQSRNTSQTRTITFNGLDLCVADWAQKLDINRRTLTARLNDGWPTEAAFTIPVGSARGLGLPTMRRSGEEPEARKKAGR